MQFFVTAYDGTDDEAPQRRAAARPAHLEVAGTLKTSGNIIVGGAILNDQDEMIGSAMCVEFESREALDEWLNNDPYVTGGVWKEISVQPIRLAIRP